MGGKSTKVTQDGKETHVSQPTINQAIRKVTESSITEYPKYTRFDEFIYGHHDFERRFYNNFDTKEIFSFPIQHLLSLNHKHRVRFGEDEVMEIQRNIEEVIKFISNDCNGYPQFNMTIKPCGSFYHMSKITAPDEFDFLMVLPLGGIRANKKVPFSASKETQISFDVKRELAYKLIQKKSDYDLETVTDWPMELIERELEMIEKESFLEFLTLLLERVPLSSNMSLVPQQDNHLQLEMFTKASGPAVTFELLWKGKLYKNLKISVDMTGLQSVSGLPEASNLKTRLPCYHPLMRESGIIGKATHELIFYAGRYKNTFTALENEIMIFWFNYLECSNTCYCLVKIIRDLFYPTDQLGAQILKTYALKMVFLYECEENPSPQSWEYNQLVLRLLSIFKRLHDALKTKNLSNYFVEDQNAFSYPLNKSEYRNINSKEGLFYNKVNGDILKTTAHIIEVLNECSTSPDSRLIESWLKKDIKEKRVINDFIIAGIKTS